MDESLPYDAGFRAALKYFLQAREWTIQELCDRTRLSPDSPPRINANSVSDWLRRSYPSGRAVIIVCKALGLPRSYFYEVGEQLVQIERQVELAERHRLRKEPDIAAALRRMSLDELEAVLRERRQELEPG